MRVCQVHAACGCLPRSTHTSRLLPAAIKDTHQSSSEKTDATTKLESKATKNQVATTSSSPPISELKRQDIDELETFKQSIELWRLAHSRNAIAPQNTTDDLEDLEMMMDRDIGRVLSDKVAEYLTCRISSGTST
jgi:hypothetical protein